MQLEPTMFRKYDLRGRVNDQELNEKTAEIIGRTFAGVLQEKGVTTCILGFDNRAYSEKLTAAAARGLSSGGIHLKNIGMVTVPVAYWAQYYLKIPGVCMGTASHNPNGWFGFKLGYGFSSTLVESEMKDLYERAINEQFITGSGSIQKVEGVVEAYQEDIVKRATLHRPLTVVVNAGNGIAGVIDVPALEKFGVKVIGQYIDSDPTFPHHEPNPTLVEFQRALSEKVLETEADLGLGFDADGDRLEIIDNQGRSLFADRVLILLSRLALKNEPGAKIIFDVKCTQALFEDIRRNGGEPVMWKTGHSLIKAKAEEIDAALAGERSGHFFFRRGYYGYDDALMASLKFLEYLSSQPKTAAELNDEFSGFVVSPVIHAACADESKEQVVSRLVKDFKKEFGEDKVSTVDGARVDFGDGWGLVRASGNLPELVLVFEGKSQERMEEIKEIFRARLKGFSEVGEFGNE